MVANVWSTLGKPPCTPAGAGEFHYALIDGAQMDGLSNRLSATSRVSSHDSLFGTPLAKDKEDATPHLLALADMEDFVRLMREWASKLTSHGALTLMISPLAPSELARRLRARLDARLPERFDCVNRFFDGRVTPHLHHCLTPTQRDVFFSPCTQWWVVAANHAWLELPCRPASEDAFHPPLELDQAQQAYLIDACYPYAVIQHFVQTDAELLATIAEREQYGFFHDALQAAAGFGIDGGATAVLFCTLALTRGARFYEEPTWRAALTSVRRSEMTLQQAVKALHD